MSQIGLLDCNNFFVSCERLFRPDLEGRAVAVLSSNDGCVVARSQEVKDLGIAMGVPYFQVKDICDREKVVLFSGNLTLYRDISSRVMQVLADEVGKCEIYSIDEAFFTLPDDVSIQRVEEIRDAVIKKVGIPVSVGVASTKTLAKQASTIGKQGVGFYILESDDWNERAKEAKCGGVWGLGRQTVTKLSELGIKTVSDFMCMPLPEIRRHFGISTERIYSELHGTSVFTVGSNSSSIRKSLASTGSFAKTTTDIVDLESAVAKHVTSISQKLRERKILCTRMNVQIQTDRYGDFFMQGHSAEVILTEPSADTQVLLKQALKEVQRMYQSNVPYKKAGVSVSSLMPESYVTHDLFTEKKDAKDSGNIDEVTDTINKKFGMGMIRSAAILDTRARSKVERRSPSYTTSWKDIPSVQAI